MRLLAGAIPPAVPGHPATHDLPASAPVLVHGSDPRLVAIVADRLTDDGFSRVFAVAR